jgi:hypothetical protein
MIDRGFHDFDVEAFFVTRLAQHGASITIGRTDTKIRKERIRKAILDNKREFTIIGQFAGSTKAETYKQLFERHYGEPLLLTAKPERKTKC